MTNDPESIGQILSIDYPAMARALHAQADIGGFRGEAYFIGGDIGCIKIGHSTDLPTRLKFFQTYSPVKLRVLAKAPGGELREAAYHAQFHDHRSHNEWFTRHPDILAEIERLNTSSQAGAGL